MGRNRFIQRPDGRMAGSAPSPTPLPSAVLNPLPVEPVTSVSWAAHRHDQVQAVATMLSTGECTCGAPLDVYPQHVCPHVAQRAMTTLFSSLMQAGLAERDATQAMEVTAGLLDADGAMSVHADAWTPVDRQAVEALRRGDLDTYEALCEGMDEATAARQAYDKAARVEQDVPGSAMAVAQALTTLAVVRTPTSAQGFTQPAVPSGPLSVVTHPYLTRLNHRTYNIDPSALAPVTVAELRDFITRTRADRTIRSVRDLALAEYLKGPLALSNGTWAVHTEAVTSDVLRNSFDMEDRAVYQVLARVYSNGRSADDGLTAWEPSGAAPVRGVREWLLAHPQWNDEAFARWALKMSDPDTTVEQ